MEINSESISILQSTNSQRKRNFRYRREKNEKEDNETAITDQTKEVIPSKERNRLNKTEPIKRKTYYRFKESPDSKKELHWVPVNSHFIKEKQQTLETTKEVLLTNQNSPSPTSTRTPRKKFIKPLKNKRSSSPTTSTQGRGQIYPAQESTDTPLKKKDNFKRRERRRPSSNRKQHRNQPENQDGVQNTNEVTSSSSSKPPSLDEKYPRMRIRRRVRKMKQENDQINDNNNANIEENNTSPNKKRRSRARFAKYLNKEEALLGIQQGILYQGTIRINPHNSRQAYVTLERGPFDRDVFIDGVYARNRAFDGDSVVVRIFDKSQWKVLKTDKEEEHEGGEGTVLTQRVEEDLIQELVEEGVEEEPLMTVTREEELEIMNETLQLQQLPQELEGEDDEGAGEEGNEGEEEEGDEDEVEEGNEEEEEEEGEDGEEEGEVEEKIIEEEEEQDQEEPEDKGEREREKERKEKEEQLEESLVPQLDKLTLESFPPTLPLNVVPTFEDVKVDVPQTETPNQNQDQSTELQPSGEVVFILERKRGEYVGFVKPQKETGVQPDDRYAVFYPTDIKVPKMLIPIGQIPEFYKNCKIYENKLVVATWVYWDLNLQLPLAKYKKMLGEAGEIPVETEAILRANKVDFRDFSEKVMDSLPKGVFEITEQELKLRRDLRKYRIFTVDPPTAKDLDDALHIKKLEDGNFEVGVHIADVSHFVRPNTPLDEEAYQRATTVYLIQKAIPMLPHILCENLCSLNPGVDRLAFSVIWTLTPRGEIKEEWFGKTVICSCSKMPYDVAQECEVNQKFENLGPAGNHQVSNIVGDILNLHDIAQELRKARYEGGALSLNNIKLHFTLDEFGNPIETHPYITKEANHMIEEFMLLANMRVARKIALAFPDAALLRNHVPPLNTKLKAFVKFCSNLGYSIQTGSGKELGKSLMEIKNSAPETVFQTIQLLGTKPMQLAKYFCTGDLDPKDWHHFALNVDYYSHFTSPIRRYPDIIVHRQLQAALILDHYQNIHSEEVEMEIAMLPKKKFLSLICQHCNEKKLLARKAQDQSAHLYLCLLLKNKPVTEDGVVVGVGDKYMSIVIPYFADEQKIYAEDLILNAFSYDEKAKKMILDWPSEPEQKGTEPSIRQEIEIMTKVKVKMTMKLKRGPISVRATLIHPKQPQ